MDAILACRGGNVLDTAGVQKSQGAWGTGDCLAIGLLAGDWNCATLCARGWPGLEGPAGVWAGPEPRARPLALAPPLTRLGVRQVSSPPLSHLSTRSVPGPPLKGGHATEADT